MKFGCNDIATRPRTDPRNPRRLLGIPCYSSPRLSRGMRALYNVAAVSVSYHTTAIAYLLSYREKELISFYFPFQHTFPLCVKPSQHIILKNTYTVTEYFQT